MTCPRCDGSKVERVYVDPGFYAAIHACRTCGGLGTISQEKFDCLCRAKTFHAKRISDRIPLHDAAKSLGITVAALSAWEMFGEPLSMDQVIGNHFIEPAALEVAPGRAGEYTSE